MIEPRNNRARHRLAVTIIRRLQSFTQWWVRLNKPHTQKFGYFHGFRPKRSQHDALDALVVGITGTKVNYILDADIDLSWMRFHTALRVIKSLSRGWTSSLSFCLL